jgi:hypothetical protein
MWSINPLNIAEIQSISMISQEQFNNFQQPLGRGKLLRAPEETTTL